MVIYSITLCSSICRYLKSRETLFLVHRLDRLESETSICRYSKRIRTFRENKKRISSHCSSFSIQEEEQRDLIFWFIYWISLKVKHVHWILLFLGTSRYFHYGHLLYNLMRFDWIDLKLNVNHKILEENSERHVRTRRCFERSERSHQSLIIEPCVFFNLKIPQQLPLFIWYFSYVHLSGKHHISESESCSYKKIPLYTFRIFID